MAGVQAFSQLINMPFGTQLSVTLASDELVILNIRHHYSPNVQWVHKASTGLTGLENLPHDRAQGPDCHESLIVESSSSFSRRRLHHHDHPPSS